MEVMLDIPGGNHLCQSESFNLLIINFFSFVDIAEKIDWSFISLAILNQYRDNFLLEYC